jgi:hypothetical protein
MQEMSRKAQTSSPQPILGSHMGTFAHVTGQECSEGTARSLAPHQKHRCRPVAPFLEAFIWELSKIPMSKPGANGSCL